MINLTPVLVSGLGGVAVPGSAPISFTLAATGNPGPAYQWQRKPAGQSTFSDLANSSTYSGVTTASLVVGNPASTMAGDQFRCVASNSVGRARSARPTPKSGGFAI